jgi:transcriptional regulator with XRE-family HTH domain
MADLSVDLDQLATHLRNKIRSGGLSLRGAAKDIGLGAATLSRLLQGSSNENVPDLFSINRAAQWLGMSLSAFSVPAKKKATTLADVEVQLRSLPGLAPNDVEALVAMVKASYESAKELRAKKSS